MADQGSPLTLHRDPLARALLILLVIIATVWLANWVWQFIIRFGDIILLFFLAWLLAFILDPLARRLQSTGLPRAAAVGVIYLGLFLLSVAAAILVIPELIVQLTQLAISLPRFGVQLQERAQDLHGALVARGVEERQLLDFYRNAISRAEAVGSRALESSVSAAGGIATGLFQFILVLILSFYVMLDGAAIAALLIRVLPHGWRPVAAEVVGYVNNTFGGWMRGNIIQAIIYGTGTAVVMNLAGLNFALAVGVFAAVAMMIPFIGQIIALAPPVLLAFVQQPERVWWLLLLLLALQFVLVNIVVPKILSESVGVHPLVIFAAVLVGARVAGGWGALFGVPIAAVLFLLGRTFYRRVVLQTPLYQSTPKRKGAAVQPALQPGEASTQPAGDAG